MATKCRECGGEVVFSTAEDGSKTMQCSKCDRTVVTEQCSICGARGMWFHGVMPRKCSQCRAMMSAEARAIEYRKIHEDCAAATVRREARLRDETKNS